MTTARGRRLFETTRGRSTPAPPDDAERALRRRAEAGDLDAQARLEYRQRDADDAPRLTPRTRTTPPGTRAEHT